MTTAGEKQSQVAVADFTQEQNAKGKLCRHRFTLRGY